MAHVLVPIINTLQPFTHPSGHRLDRADAKPRVALEHAIDDHRGQRLARVLDEAHREIHHRRLRVVIEIAAGIMTMRDEMEADGEVEILRRRPNRVEIRMAEALALDWHRGKERCSRAEFRYTLHLRNRHR